jgi:hypothetical protein
MTWKCELCGEDDNATRFHNTFRVEITGEGPATVGDSMGEEKSQSWELELCDKCARMETAGKVARVLLWTLDMLELERAHFGELLEPVEERNGEEEENTH